MTDIYPTAAAQDLAWFRASERGNGVGLTVLNDGGTRSPLVIHVLPKLWRGSTSPRSIQAPTTGGSVDAYEGDYVGFPPVWAARMETTVASGAEATDTHSSDHESGAGDQLWAPVARPRRPDPSVERPELRTAMWDLLLASSQQIAPVPGSIADFSAAAGILGSMPELRPLLQSVFVDRAVAAIPLRKPIYREVMESLGVVRGRILTAPLVRRQATRSLRIDCEFDALTGDGDVWRAIKTALVACTETIARTDLVREALARLDDVGIVDAASVLSRARRGWSSRDPKLKELHDLAAAVLRSDSRHSGEGATTSGVAINVKFVTSDLWEHLLVEAFRGAGADVSKPRLPLFYRRGSTGWKASTGKAPDLLVSPPGGGKIIVDAKYMANASLHSAPMSAQYQIATYALRSGAPAFLALSAPPGDAASDDATAEVTMVPALWDEWEQRHLPDTTPPQYVIVGSIRLRFPAPGDASYLARLVAQAQQLLTVVEAKMGSPDD